jgi:hypothetical protein
MGSLVLVPDLVGAVPGRVVDDQDLAAALLENGAWKTLQHLHQRGLGLVGDDEDEQSGTRLLHVEERGRTGAPQEDTPQEPKRQIRSVSVCGKEGLRGGYARFLIPVSSRPLRKATMSVSSKAVVSPVLQTLETKMRT